MGTRCVSNWARHGRSRWRGRSRGRRRGSSRRRRVWDRRRCSVCRQVCRKMGTAGTRRWGGSAKDKTRLTALQQNPPQQDSPGTQKVLPQQVDPVGAQKGARVVEAAMQHWSKYSSRQQSVFGAKVSRELCLPPGLKHSQLRSRAPRSFALLGKTHASPGVTLR